MWLCAAVLQVLAELRPPPSGDAHSAGATLRKGNMNMKLLCTVSRSHMYCGHIGLVPILVEGTGFASTRMEVYWKAARSITQGSTLQSLR